jgi:transcription antitermination factor NusG
VSSAAAKRIRSTTAEAEAAAQRLCDTIPPGSTVYAIRRARSRSGNLAYLDMYAITDGRLLKITDDVAAATRLKQSAPGYIIVRGWGDDAAWHVVQQLSYALHGLVGQGAGLDPAATCDVSDAQNYRAGHSLRVVWL